MSPAMHEPTCENCRYFDEDIIQGSDKRITGTCHDTSKIIFAHKSVPDSDNSPRVYDAKIFTCLNHEYPNEES